jgi:anti-sigma factor RsiW
VHALDGASRIKKRLGCRDLALNLRAVRHGEDLLRGQVRDERDAVLSRHLAAEPDVPRRQTDFEARSRAEYVNAAYFFALRYAFLAARPAMCRRQLATASPSLRRQVSKINSQSLDSRLPAGTFGSTLFAQTGALTVATHQFELLRIMWS